MIEIIFILYKIFIIDCTPNRDKKFEYNSKDPDFKKMFFNLKNIFDSNSSKSLNFTYSDLKEIQNIISSIDIHNLMKEINTTNLNLFNNITQQVKFDQKELERLNTKNKDFKRLNLDNKEIDELKTLFKNFNFNNFKNLFEYRNDDIESSSCLILAFDSKEKYSKYIHSQDYNQTDFLIDLLIEFKNISNDKSENNFSFKTSFFDLGYGSSFFESEYKNLDNFRIKPNLASYNSYLETTDKNLNLVLEYLFEIYNKKLNKDILIKTLPMKTQEYKEESDSPADLGNIIPVTLSISYISILFQFVLWMVNEKEQKLKDLFLRQGVSIKSYFLSWFLTFLILTLPTIFINTIFLKNYFFNNTNFFLIFLNLFLFCINILSMALVFHQFANDVRTGQSLLKFLYIGISILSVPISKDGVPYIFKILFSIFPQTLLRNSFEILSNGNVNAIFFKYINYYFKINHIY